MLEPITLALATPIAKIVLDKFYEGVGSKLAEKAVSAATAPIQKLGQLVWERCLKLTNDPKKANELLQSAATGSEEAQKALTQGVHQVLANDPAFEQEVRGLAAEIYQVINIDEMSGGEIWNVSGGVAKKEIFTDNKAPIFKDVQNSPITINYNTPSG